MNILLALYLVITAIILLILAVFGWRRRSVRAGREFALLAGSIAFYIAAYALELTQGTLEVLKLTLRVECCFIPYIPTFWLMFSLAWCGYGHLLNRPVRIALFALSTVVLLIAQTNDLHGLMYSAVWVDSTGPFPALMVHVGYCYWGYFVYLNACSLISNALFIRQFRSIRALHRRQALILLTASCIPWLTVIAYFLDIGPRGIYLDPFGFSVTALLFAWGIFRGQLLNLVPVARHGLVEMMRDPVLVFDDAGRLVDHNRAACQLLPDRESREVVTLAEISPVTPELAEALEWAKKQDGATFQQEGQIYSLSLTTLRPSDGQTLTLCLCHDITGQARATELAEERTRQLAVQTSALEAALEERHRAFEQQKKFLAMISHEYRTPLAIINGNLHLLKQYGDDPRTGPPVVKISRAADRLLHLLETSLEHSQMEEECPQPVRAPLLSGALLAELAADAVREWPEREFQQELNIPADTVIEADPALLRVALWNLVVNAVSYSPPEQPIIVSGREDASGIYLEVADHGPGIPTAERERIFDKYYRGRTSAGTSGSGVGLWLVRWIVDEHGGSVILRNNEPTGTVITIRLPAPV